MCDKPCKGRIGSYGGACNCTGEDKVHPLTPYNLKTERNNINPTEAYDGGGISTRDFIMAKDLNYSEGCIVKYIVRHGEKNGKEDLGKAMNYLEYLIDNYEDIYKKGAN